MIELLVIGLFVAALSAALLLVIGVIVGLVYGRFYWDGQEYTGTYMRPGLRSWSGWRLLHRYFDIRIEEHESFKRMDVRQHNILYVVYPHGFVPVHMYVGVLLHAGHPRLSRLAENAFIGAASFLFVLPGYRELCMAMGLVDVSAKHLRTFLDERKKLHRPTHLAISPGGLREMIRTRMGCDDFYLGHRGFLDFAEREQFDYVVPIYVDGATDAFLQSSKLFRVRDWMVTHLRVPAPFMVLPVPLPGSATIHVGEPVAVSSSAGATATKRPRTAEHTVSRLGHGDSLKRRFAGSFFDVICKSTKDKSHMRLWQDRDTFSDLDKITADDVANVFE